MRNTVKIIASRYDTGGNAIEWKITSVIDTGGQADKKARAWARKKAREVLGAWYFYKNPPSQGEVDLKINGIEK